MDSEKPVKAALSGAIIAFDNVREAIDVSMAALTKAIELVRAANDKFHEFAYKDGNLEMKEID